jgi:hypothetical protein
VRKAHEQPVFYDSGAVVELSSKLRGIFDWAEIAIEDHIALVCAVLFPICGEANNVLSSQRLDVPGG